MERDKKPQTASGLSDIVMLVNMLGGEEGGAAETTFSIRSQIVRRSNRIRPSTVPLTTP